MKKRTRSVRKRSEFKNSMYGPKARSNRGQFSLRSDMRKLDGVRKKVASSTKFTKNNDAYVFRTNKYSKTFARKIKQERKEQRNHKIETLTNFKIGKGGGVHLLKAS